MRYTTKGSLAIFRLVDDSELGIKRILKELGMNNGTFNSWYSKC